MSEERKQLIIDPRTRQYVYVEYVDGTIKEWDIGRYNEIVIREGLMAIAPMRGMLLRVDMEDVTITTWSAKIALIGILARFSKENYNTLRGVSSVIIDPDTYQYITRDEVTVRIGEYARIRGNKQKIKIERIEAITELEYRLEELGVIAVAESPVDVIVHHNIAKARGEQ
jgi:hypothetical protein